MKKHTAISPDGSVATRNSKTKTYGICVFGFGGGVWQVMGWSRDLTTAQKMVASEKSACKRYGCKFPYLEISFVNVEVA